MTIGLPPRMALLFGGIVAFARGTALCSRQESRNNEELARAAASAGIRVVAPAR